mgnify:CR=1 FL=1
MPNTRPGSIFKDGVCQACLNHDKRKEIDWDLRKKKLDNMCRSLKSNRPDKYDCIIAISGGKDSYFITDLYLKMGLNPLLVRVSDGFSMSKESKYNLKNLITISKCDFIEISISPYYFRELTRSGFEELGNFPFFDYMIYNMPIRLAQKMGISAVFYGENPSYEYGTSAEDSFLVPLTTSCDSNLIWIRETCPDLISDLLVPTEWDKATKAIYTSYFIPWSGYGNYEFAKKMGFKSLDYRRSGNIEDYDQIDSWGWQISNYLKFLKFGFGRSTDIASRLIREGRLERYFGIKMVEAFDSKLDDSILYDFLNFTGYTETEFWNIANRWVNRDILTNDSGYWILKPELKSGG